MGNISLHLDTKIHAKIACSCGCGFGTKPEHLDIDLAWLVERARYEVGQIVGYEVGCNIHCWARCRQHNAELTPPGHPRSQHMGRPPTQRPFVELAGKAAAVDFHIPGVNHAVLFRVINKWHRGGLGLYRWGVHMDTGNYSRWGNS